MPTLIIKGKITKGYDHWLAAYDGAEELRKTKYGIKTIFRGQDLNEPDTIHVVMHTPTMEAIQTHMENDAELISDNNPAADAVVIKRQSFLFLIEGITALAAQT